MGGIGNMNSSSLISNIKQKVPMGDSIPFGQVITGESVGFETHMTVEKAHKGHEVKIIGRGC